MMAAVLDRKLDMDGGLVSDTINNNSLTSGNDTITSFQDQKVEIAVAISFVSGALMVGNVSAEVKWRIFHICIINDHIYLLGFIRYPMHKGEPFGFKCKVMITVAFKMTNSTEFHRNFKIVHFFLSLNFGDTAKYKNVHLISFASCLLDPTWESGPWGSNNLYVWAVNQRLYFWSGCSRACQSVEKHPGTEN